MSDKITVSKQGEIYRVPVDPASMQPIRISAFNEEPPGAFMQTYTSLAELRQVWGNREFIFLEPPAKKENTVGPLSAELQAKADSIAAKFGLKNGPTKTVAVAVETGQVLKPVAMNDDARLLHAQEVLKRLETAREYASKKNQKELDIKIQAVKELINEVFNT